MKKKRWLMLRKVMSDTYFAYQLSIVMFWNSMWLCPFRLRAPVDTLAPDAGRKVTTPPLPLFAPLSVCDP